MRRGANIKFSLNEVFENRKLKINKSLVYRIRNVVNNKSYIGSTSQPFRRRMLQHKRNLSSYKYHLYNAINKYGVENFEVEILFVCKNTLQMYNLEEFFIFIFDSYHNGYNRSLNGRAIQEVGNKELSTRLKSRWKSQEFRTLMSKVVHNSNKHRWSDINERKHLLSHINNMNKNPIIKRKQQMSKCKKIISRLNDLNIEVNETMWNKFKTPQEMKYSTAIRKYPELF